jgi:hypothetical protein
LPGRGVRQFSKQPLSSYPGLTPEVKQSLTGRLRAGSEIRLQPNAANALGGGGEGEAKDLFVYNDEQDDAKAGDERDVEWARAARKELARDMLAAYEDGSPCYPVGGECERQTCNRIQETKLLVDKEVIQNKVRGARGRARIVARS